MFGSGKNREQKKERKQNKKSKDSVYNTKYVRLQEKKQELSLARKAVETAKEKKPTKSKTKKGGGAYNYIINPLTNRKVATNGALGKKIINNFIRALGGGGTLEECIDNRTNKSKKGQCYFGSETNDNFEWRIGTPPKATSKKCLENCNKIANPKKERQKGCDSCKVDDL